MAQAVKLSTYSVGGLGLIPGSGSPGEGNGSPLCCSFFFFFVIFKKRRNKKIKSITFKTEHYVSFGQFLEMYFVALISSCHVFLSLDRPCNLLFKTWHLIKSLPSYFSLTDSLPVKWYNGSASITYLTTQFL